MAAQSGNGKASKAVVQTPTNRPVVRHSLRPYSINADASNRVDAGDERASPEIAQINSTIRTSRGTGSTDQDVSPSLPIARTRADEDCAVIRNSCRAEVLQVYRQVKLVRKLVRDRR